MRTRSVFHLSLATSVAMSLAMSLAMLATLALSAGAQSSTQQPAAQRNVQRLEKVWAIAGDSATFAAPRSLVIAGDCLVWVADSATGAWRVPCDGNAPIRVPRPDSATVGYGAAALVALAGRDSVVVLDHQSQTLLYDAAGAFARGRPLNVPELVHGRVQHFVPVGGDGSLIVWTVKPPSLSDRNARSSVIGIRADGTVRSVLTILSAPQSLVYDTLGGGAVVAAPAQRRPFVVWMREGGFAVGHNDDARVALHDALGNVSRSLMLPLPSAAALTRADRDAYADSVKRALEREMELLRYDDSTRAQRRAELERMLASALFPPLRQRYDHLIVDDREQALWVQLPGSGASYERTWMVCALTELSYCRTVRVAHEGAVVAVAIRDGVLYAIERSRDGVSRVARYGPQ